MRLVTSPDPSRDLSDTRGYVYTVTATNRVVTRLLTRPDILVTGYEIISPRERMGICMRAPARAYDPRTPETRNRRNHAGSARNHTRNQTVTNIYIL